MKGISRLIEEVKNIENAESLGQRIYFRGQRCCDKLLPSLLRKNVPYYKENNIYCDCWVMGNHEFSATKNSWEVLAIMQHYGMPTRLLDWSKSITSAIYFAISDCIDCNKKCKSAKSQKNNVKCKGNPTIWMLDTDKLHDKFYPDLDLSGFTIGIDELPEYIDIFVKSDTKNWKYKKGPIFLEIPWNNQRIRQQKGYFTFHYSKKALEDIVPEAVKKIEIAPEWKNEILDEFKYYGINEFDVYPDLISLSRHMRRVYQL